MARMIDNPMHATGMVQYFAISVQHSGAVKERKEESVFWYKILPDMVSLQVLRAIK